MSRDRICPCVLDIPGWILDIVVNRLGRWQLW